jgi:CheY-like chemotaxis protein
MVPSLQAPPSELEPRGSTSDAFGRPTVIVADDDPALVQFLSIRLKESGFDVFRSPDAMHALLGAHHIRPRLVIVDVHMPGGNGLSVCDMIYSDGGLRDTAVIVMTGDADEAVARRCNELGTECVRKGPQLWDQLRQTIRRQLQSTPLPGDSLLELAPLTDGPAHEAAGAATVGQRSEASTPESPSPPATTAARPTILTIDDDQDVTYMMKLRLERLGMNVVEAATGMQGFWKAVECRPQAIICDLNMPDGEGSYIYGRLMTHPVTKSIPVIILTGLSNPALRRHMLGLGVAAFLPKPVVFETLLGELGKLVASSSTELKGGPPRPSGPDAGIVGTGRGMPAAVGENTPGP